MPILLYLPFLSHLPPAACGSLHRPSASPSSPSLSSTVCEAAWHKQDTAFRLAAACPPTRRVRLWWLHKALFHFGAAEGGGTCGSVWQAAPEGVCKRQTHCQESHYPSQFTAWSSPGKDALQTATPETARWHRGAGGDASAGLEGTAGTSGAAQTSKGCPRRARESSGGMREEYAEPAEVCVLLGAGWERQTFSSGRHSNRAATICKTPSSVSVLM